MDELSDRKSKESISEKQQWLLDHADNYVIQSKTKDEALILEKDNIKYYCELEVSVNCLELILLELNISSSSSQEVSSSRRSKSLKTIIATLVEDVARHAVLIDYSPMDQRSSEEENKSQPQEARSSRHINDEQFTIITENTELQLLLPIEDDKGRAFKPTIRLFQSSLKRNIKRKKAKPRYPAYMWVLGGSNKRIIPPRHATDFYYRLLEGNAGYPSNYLGACINDLASQGIIEVAGKRLIISEQGADLAKWLLGRNQGKGPIYWKVRVVQKKDRVEKE
jgi:hypothetical protein